MDELREIIELGKKKGIDINAILIQNPNIDLNYLKTELQKLPDVVNNPIEGAIRGVQSAFYYPVQALGGVLQALPFETTKDIGKAISEGARQNLEQLAVSPESGLLGKAGFVVGNILGQIPQMRLIPSKIFPEKISPYAIPFVYYAPISTFSTYAEQEEGQKDLIRALGTGIISGALESPTFGSILSNLPKTFVSKLTKPNLLKEFLKVGTIETITEALQEGVEEYGRTGDIGHSAKQIPEYLKEWGLPTFLGAGLIGGTAEYIGSKYQQKLEEFKDKVNKYKLTDTPEEKIQLRNAIIDEFNSSRFKEDLFTVLDNEERLEFMKAYKDVITKRDTIIEGLKEYPNLEENSRVIVEKLIKENYSELPETEIQKLRNNLTEEENILLDTILSKEIKEEQPQIEESKEQLQVEEETIPQEKQRTIDTLKEILLEQFTTFEKEPTIENYLQVIDTIEELKKEGYTQEQIIQEFPDFQKVLEWETKFKTDENNQRIQDTISKDIQEKRINIESESTDIDNILRNIIYIDKEIREIKEGLKEQKTKITQENIAEKPQQIKQEAERSKETIPTQQVEEPQLIKKSSPHNLEKTEEDKQPLKKFLEKEKEKALKENDIERVLEIDRKITELENNTLSNLETTQKAQKSKKKLEAILNSAENLQIIEQAPKTEQLQPERIYRKLEYEKERQEITELQNTLANLENERRKLSEEINNKKNEIIQTFVEEKQKELFREIQNLEQKITELNKNIEKGILQIVREEYPRIRNLKNYQLQSNGEILYRGSNKKNLKPLEINPQNAQKVIELINKSQNELEALTKKRQELETKDLTKELDKNKISEELKKTIPDKINKLQELNKEIEDTRKKLLEYKEKELLSKVIITDRESELFKESILKDWQIKYTEYEEIYKTYEKETAKPKEQKQTDKQPVKTKKSSKIDKLLEILKTTEPIQIRNKEAIKKVFNTLSKNERKQLYEITKYNPKERYILSSISKGELTDINKEQGYKLFERFIYVLRAQNSEEPKNILQTIQEFYKTLEELELPDNKIPKEFKTPQTVYKQYVINKYVEKISKFLTKEETENLKNLIKEYQEELPQTKKLIYPVDEDLIQKHLFSIANYMHVATIERTVEQKHTEEEPTTITIKEDYLTVYLPDYRNEEIVWNEYILEEAVERLRNAVNNPEIELEGVEPKYKNFFVQLYKSYAQEIIEKTKKNFKQWLDDVYEETKGEGRGIAKGMGLEKRYDLTGLIELLTEDKRLANIVYGILRDLKNDKEITLQNLEPDDLSIFASFIHMFQSPETKAIAIEKIEGKEDVVAEFLSLVPLYTLLEKTKDFVGYNENSKKEYKIIPRRLLEILEDKYAPFNLQLLLSKQYIDLFKTNALTLSDDKYHIDFYIEYDFLNKLEEYEQSYKGLKISRIRNLLRAIRDSLTNPEKANIFEEAYKKLVDTYIEINDSIKVWDNLSLYFVQDRPVIINLTKTQPLEIIGENFYIFPVSSKTIRAIEKKLKKDIIKSAQELIDIIENTTGDVAGYIYISKTPVSKKEYINLIDKFVKEKLLYRVQYEYINQIFGRKKFNSDVLTTIVENLKSIDEVLKTIPTKEYKIEEERKPQFVVDINYSFYYKTGYAREFGGEAKEKEIRITLPLDKFLEDVLRYKGEKISKEIRKQTLGFIEHWNGEVLSKAEIEENPDYSSMLMPISGTEYLGEPYLKFFFLLDPKFITPQKLKLFLKDPEAFYSELEKFNNETIGFIVEDRRGKPQEQEFYGYSGSTKDKVVYLDYGYFPIKLRINDITKTEQVKTVVDTKQANRKILNALTEIYRQAIKTFNSKKNIKDEIIENNAIVDTLDGTEVLKENAIYYKLSGFFTKDKLIRFISTRSIEKLIENNKITLPEHLDISQAFYNFFKDYVPAHNELLYELPVATFKENTYLLSLDNLTIIYYKSSEDNIGYAFIFENNKGLTKENAEEKIRDLINRGQLTNEERVIALAILEGEIYDTSNLNFENTKEFWQKIYNKLIERNRDFANRVATGILRTITIIERIEKNINIFSLYTPEKILEITNRLENLKTEKQANKYDLYVLDYYLEKLRDFDTENSAPDLLNLLIAHEISPNNDILFMNSLHNLTNYERIEPNEIFILAEEDELTEIDEMEFRLKTSKQIKNNPFILADKRFYADVVAYYLRKILGKPVEVRFYTKEHPYIKKVEALKGEFYGFAHRLVDRNLIGVVLDQHETTTEMLTTIFHEAFHLIEQGLSPTDKKLLYAKYKNVEDIADDFGKYVAGKIEPPSFAKRLFDMFLRFIEKLRNFFNGLGFYSTKDIYDRIIAGMYATIVPPEQIPAVYFTKAYEMSFDEKLFEQMDFRMKEDWDEKLKRIQDELKARVQPEEYLKKVRKFIDWANSKIKNIFVLPIYHPVLSRIADMYKNTATMVNEMIYTRANKIMELYNKIEAQGLTKYVEELFIYSNANGYLWEGKNTGGRDIDSYIKRWKELKPEQKELIKELYKQLHQFYMDIVGDYYSKSVVELLRQLMDKYTIELLKYINQNSQEAQTTYEENLKNLLQHLNNLFKLYLKKPDPRKKAQGLLWKAFENFTEFESVMKEISKTIIENVVFRTRISFLRKTAEQGLKNILKNTDEEHELYSDFYEDWGKLRFDVVMEYINKHYDEILTTAKDKVKFVKWAEFGNKLLSAYQKAELLGGGLEYLNQAKELIEDNRVKALVDAVYNTLRIIADLNEMAFSLRDGFIYGLSRRGGTYFVRIYQKDLQTGTYYPTFYIDTSKKHSMSEEEQYKYLKREIERQLQAHKKATGQTYKLEDSVKLFSSNKGLYQLLSESTEDIIVIHGIKEHVLAGSSKGELSEYEIISYLFSIMQNPSEISHFSKIINNVIKSYLPTKEIKMKAEASKLKETLRIFVPDVSLVKGEDVRQVLIDDIDNIMAMITNKFFTASYFNLIAQNKNFREMLYTDNDLRTTVINYTKMLMTPQNKFANVVYKIRGLIAVWTLGLNLKTALLNFLNFPSIFAPIYSGLIDTDLNTILKRFDPEAQQDTTIQLKPKDWNKIGDYINKTFRTIKELKQLTDYVKIIPTGIELNFEKIKKLRYPRNDREFKQYFILKMLYYLSLSGSLESNLTRTLKEEGQFGKYSKLFDTAMIVFKSTETWARIISAIMLAELFVDKMNNDYKLEERIGKSEEVIKTIGRIIDKTYFRYDKVNRPFWTNPNQPLGVLGAMMTTLKGFSLSYLSLLYELYGHKEFRQIMLMLGVLLLAGGLLALPGGDQAYELLDEFYKKIVGRSMKVDLKRYLGEHFGNTGYNVLMYGIPTLFGIDLSRSVALEIPFVPTDFTFEGLLDTYFGIQRTLYKRIVEKGLGGMLDGDLDSAVYMLPLGVGLMIEGIRLNREGLTTKYGVPVIEDGEPIHLSEFEALLRSLGFRPVRLAEIQNDRRMIMELDQLMRKHREKIYKRYRKDGLDTDLIDDIIDYNRKAIEYGQPVITSKSLKQVASKREDLSKKRIELFGKE